MKGDISADFHAPEKRYTGVRAQQGRVLTDADFNAAMDVVDDALDALVRRLICAAGTTDAGFEITAAFAQASTLADGAQQQTYDLTIAPGSFVLGGRAIVLPEPQAFLSQTDWIAQALEASALPPAPVDGRVDLVYLESITQPVRAVEDREIQERALGSADTTTRLRPQLKIRIEPDTVDECVIAMAGLRATLAGSGGSFSDDGTELLSNARLNIDLSGPGDVTDPCAPRSLSGYLGSENQTLRVMLTEPGSFVWAYDHGEPLYRVQIDEGEIVFVTPPRDPVLFPGAGMVIEILPWDVLLPNGEKAAAHLGHRALLTGAFDPTTNRIAFDGSLPADWQNWLATLSSSLEGLDDVPSRYFYARIWEAPESGGTQDSVGAAVPLAQTGVQLTFSGNGFAGDYWTISLRPDAPETVVPWRLLDAVGAPPVGPRRFYAALALVGWDAPAGGAPSATISDCRNKFRRLCQIKGCCSFQVGDGRSSFGDFNDIQAAVDALPAAGGEICLLPGLHEGRVNLTGRQNVTIHGCGRRSIVMQPDGGAEPLFRVSGTHDLILRNFVIRTSGALAVQAVSNVQHCLLENLDIRVTGAAIDVPDVSRFTIRNCVIQARIFPVALSREDFPGLRPLVYLAGDDITVTGSTLEAEQRPNAQDVQNANTDDVIVVQDASKNRYALGGLWIGGNSRRTRIHDNIITGGNGNGITLGSVTILRPSGQEFTGPGVFTILEIDEGGCPQFNPPGSFRIPPVDPNDPDPPRIESDGPLIDLRIENNHIGNHGASGISVGYWFVATEDARDDAFDDIEIEDAVIAGNVIQRCMQIDLSAALSADAAFATGFGGIALASAVDLQVENNDIRRCGPGRTSICGLYVRYGERISITDNRIYENGRPATFSDPLLVGNIGGIVLSQVEGREEAFGRGLRQTPALIVRDNTVVSPEGRALEVVGSGQMIVESNALTAHGNNSLGLLILAFAAATNRVTADRFTTEGVQGQFRAFMAQILGSCVAILNTGLNPNFGILLGGITAQGRQGSTLASNSTFAIQRSLPPQGPVLFNDNQVTFDAANNASTLSLCSVGIVSLDDVAMQDNQCMVDAFNDVVIANAVVLGFVSTRVQGNRFRETINAAFFANNNPDDNPVLPISTLLSAVTFGLMNATEMNQGTHCFLRLGPWQPRIRRHPFNAERPPVLDTNRTLVGSVSELFLDRGVCDVFFRRSFSEE
ncbi:MAG: right-handed parallel beta-helix repeat-containing protein [Paracoccaceae bacterium]